MSAKLFNDYLVEKLGLAPTRSPEFSDAFSKLHAALANMDVANQDIIQAVGLNELMKRFSKIEEVKTVLNSNIIPFPTKIS